jgi:hypothetical protein
MSKLSRTAAILAATVVFAGSSSELAAQNASISANAIVAGALSVTSVRDLDFGTVIPNFNRTILTTDATSGHFQIDGGVNAEVSLTYSSLPGALTRVGGTETMTITYTATHNTTDAGGVGTGFTPASGLTTRLDTTTGELHVYMGGLLTVASGQVAGDYSATITLDASYTGN